MRDQTRREEAKCLQNNGITCLKVVGLQTFILSAISKLLFLLYYRK